MAFVNDPEQDKNAAAPGVPQPTTAGGAAPAVSKTPTANTANQTAGANSPAQPFQNIGSYLSANAPQTQDTANKIAGDFGTTEAGVKSDLGTASNAFEKSVQDNTKTLSPDQIAAAAKTPNKFAENPSDAATFESLYRATSPYSGPTDFAASSPDLAAKAVGAAKTGALTNDFSGIQTYLHSRGPQRTAGQDVLDTTLLQGNPGATATLQGAGQKLQALPGLVKDATSAENDLAAAGKNATEQTAAGLHAAVDPAISAFQSDIASRTAAARSNADQVTSKVQSDLAKGDVAAIRADFDAAKADPAKAKTIIDALTALSQDYGTTPDLTSNNLFSFAPGAEIRPENVATPQDYASAAAWAKLTGQDLSGTLNPAYAGQAGTAPSPYSGLGLDAISSTATNALGAKDQQVIGAKFLNDVSATTGIPNVYDAAHMGDPAIGARMGAAITDIARRNGIAAARPMVQSILNTGRAVLANHADGDPTVAGVASLVRSLSALIPSAPIGIGGGSGSNTTGGILA